MLNILKNLPSVSEGEAGKYMCSSIFKPALSDAPVEPDQSDEDAEMASDTDDTEANAEADASSITECNIDSKVGSVV